MVGRARTAGALRLGAAALLVAGAAPLRAQDADSAGACLPAAQADGGGATRWACTGAGYDAAVRFAAAFPEGWAVTPPGDAELVIGAGRESAGISVSAQDQLHAPRTRSDSLGFWMRAARLHRGAEPEFADVSAFRAQAGDPAGARRAVTAAQQADSALLAMARDLSVGRDGTRVLRQAAEVRALAGRPAGFLDESYETGGVAWRMASYVTVHDATVFIAALAAPDDEFGAALDAWERVLASLEIGTDRDESPPRAQH